MKIEVTEFQIALFSSKFDLSDEAGLISEVKEVFNLQNATQNILPPSQGSTLPRIYLLQDDIEIQAGDFKINLVLKQTTERGLTNADLYDKLRKFIGINYFNNTSFSRIGYAVTEVKHVKDYKNFIKKVFTKDWSQDAETFLSRNDYFFDTDDKREAYLIVNMQTVLNNSNEKGILCQFDVSTKETVDIDIDKEKVQEVVKSLSEATFFNNKKKLFETP